MISHAFIIGFFTAMGWFSAQKVFVMANDSAKVPMTIEKKE